MCTVPSVHREKEAIYSAQDHKEHLHRVTSIMSFQSLEITVKT